MIRQIDVLLDGAQQEGLLAIAQPLMIGLVLGVDELVGPDEFVAGVDARSWCTRMQLVFVWLSMSSEAAAAASFGSLTIDTQPFGPMTSFTKNATSLIIGPQPASYQPTDPSSNVTCSWP